VINTALIITKEQDSGLIRLFDHSPEVNLVAVACLDGEIGWLTEKERKNLFVTTSLDKIAALPELDTIVDATGEQAVGEYLRKIINGRLKIEELPPNYVLSTIISSRQHYQEARILKGELLAILNAVQDAIEVVDEKGIIKYVNPAFTRVSGIPESERINRSIFDVSPHGALSQSLIQQKPVTGYRTFVGGSEADVISNASPIIVGGQLMGAVVVFQPVCDILKLMDELKYSNTVIDNLYAQIEKISGSRFSFDSLIGQSKAFRATVEKARRASRSDASLLIRGEYGTGKSLFARAIHNSSSRCKRPLIIVDCAAVPDSLQEIEIFGCERGAMPGILRTRLGKLELAAGSTLFIKEITALNPHLQNQILRVLDEHSFCRIGGDKPIPVDIRVIASADSKLIASSIQGYFSEEIYRRLNQVAINLPPLRKRPEDIPLLAEVLIDRLNRKLGKNVAEISPRVLQELSEYEWPGNINELNSVIERAMAMVDGSVIEYQHLAIIGNRPGTLEGPVLDEITPLDKMEEMMIKLALTRYGETLEGKKKAAQALNISLATLYNKLKKSSV
jgi:PAS domain S-box-containing protein